MAISIDDFKKLTLEEKLHQIKYNATLLGSYDRPNEDGGKVPGDIYELGEFWVYLSEDEDVVVPSRRNPIKVKEEDEE